MKDNLPPPQSTSGGNILRCIERSYWTGAQFRATRADPRKVLAAQQGRLRELLQTVSVRSAFYREKFRHLDVKTADLAVLPVTTKSEMMAHFDQVVTDPAISRAGVEEFIEDSRNVPVPFLGKYSVSHTSGSQGQPTLIVQNQRVLDLLFAFQMTRGHYGHRGGFMGLIDAMCILREPARLAVVINQQGFFPSAWVWKRLPQYMHAFMKFLFVSGTDPDLVNKINDFSPNVLSSTPTTLDLLSLKIDQFRLPKLRQVVTWSETLTVPARRRISEAFRVPVMDNYAAGECMFLTNGCPAGPGAHVNADWAIVEVVDEQNRPVPPGELGHKVLLTNLANTVQPFIRYEIGDRLVMATEPCSCGNRMPKIEKIVGRAADFFWVRVGTGFRPLTAYPFQHAFDYRREVREWQAEQVERNSIVVRLEPIPGAVADVVSARKRLDERLALVGLRDELDIRIESVPRLLTDVHTAKFRRMISRVGIPEDLDGGMRQVAEDFAQAAVQV
ncbi:phenylacetate--CoA ligase family protein [Prosthecobacter sp.]|uniref:phenylacetate--CoA ligase family protein n=1 Tax=Prosthecobacter sp. TaxID=1965333 RepID=UPI003782EE87